MSKLEKIIKKVLKAKTLGIGNQKTAVLRKKNWSF